MDTYTPERVALSLEAEFDRSGWDNQPATFMVIGSTGSGLKSFAVPLGLGKDHPRDDMAKLSWAYTQPSTWHEMLRKLYADMDFIGHAVVLEAWQKNFTDEEVAARQAGEDQRDLADIVGSVETRLVHLISGDGDEVMVNHIRGREPEVHHQAGSVFWEGAIPRHLKAIHAIAGFWLSQEHSDG